MSPTLLVRHLALRVHDLDRSVAFYTGPVGFAVVYRDAAIADLAVTADAAPVLRLVERHSAPAAPHTAAGLFHGALLLPSREALGAWLRGAAERGVEFDGFSDHAVSEAIYFSDPDGNGLEFYADRPRSQWPYANDEVQMVTRPLDLPSLLSGGRAAGPAPLANASWGHIHLRVTDLDRSEQFYGENLGLVVTQRSYAGARFLAADGYHHHVGINVWGRPRQPQPPGALGLAGVTFARRDLAEARDLHDPDGIPLRIEQL